MITVTPFRVLVVDERRLLAAGLAHVLADRPEVSEASVLQELTSLPAALAAGWDVVVSSENYATHVLRVVPASTRVLVVVRNEDPRAIATLLKLGAAGICTPADLPSAVADAVAQLGRAEMRLPAHLVHQVLDELVLLRQRAQSADDVLAQLTQRERDVLAGLGQGRGRAEIGRQLGLSPHTVRTHVQHVLRKLSLHSQLEAGAFARELSAALHPGESVGTGQTVVSLEPRRAAEADSLVT